MSKVFNENFCEEIKPHLYKRIGRELRLARYVLDLGCGSFDLVKYLDDSYHQQVTGVDVSSESFLKKLLTVWYRVSLRILERKKKISLYFLQ